VIVRLNRPSDVTQSHWVDNTILAELKSKLHEYRAGVVKVGPLDWNHNQSEFLNRLMALDLTAVYNDPKFLLSPLLDLLSGQLDLVDPGQSRLSPFNFAADRARYLGHHRRKCLAEWLTGEQCPEKATAGLLKDFDFKDKPVIPFILDSEQHVSSEVIDWLAAAKVRAITGTRIMGIIPKSNRYYAFVISLVTPQARAIIFDPFPGQQMDIGCRNILEALIWKSEAGREIRCEYDEYFNVSPFTVFPPDWPNSIDALEKRVRCSGDRLLYCIAIGGLGSLEHRGDR
jgi:hypothetical protein